MRERITLSRIEGERYVPFTTKRYDVYSVLVGGNQGANSKKVGEVTARTRWRAGKKARREFSNISK